MSISTLISLHIQSRCKSSDYSMLFYRKIVLSINRFAFSFTSALFWTPLCTVVTLGRICFAITRARAAVKCMFIRVTTSPLHICTLAATCQAVEHPVTRYWFDTLARALSMVSDPLDNGLAVSVFDFNANSFALGRLASRLWRRAPSDTSVNLDMQAG